MDFWKAVNGYKETIVIIKSNYQKIFMIYVPESWEKCSFKQIKGGLPIVLYFSEDEDI